MPRESFAVLVAVNLTAVLFLASPANAVEICIHVTPELDEAGDLRFRVDGTAKPAHRVEHSVGLTLRYDATNVLTCGFGSSGTWTARRTRLGACGSGAEPGLQLELSADIATAPPLRPDTLDDPPIPLGVVTAVWEAGDARPGVPLQPPACRVFPD